MQGVCPKCGVQGWKGARVEAALGYVHRVAQKPIGLQTKEFR
jgi:hypothetical protein